VSPTGVAGEICIGGEGVGRGYLGEAWQTAEKFTTEEYGRGEGERMYRTGDLGRYLENGRIVYEGRRDDQVKLRGYRIELGEIEEVLRSYAGVREAVVTMREDEPGQKRLVGYVTERQEEVIEGKRRRRIPNGMAIVEQNKNETEYLYEEIFKKKSYFKHGIGLPENGCVFDVGANIGLFTLFIGQNRKGARVYAFEPIKPIYETLRINAGLYGGERVKLYQIGLGEENRKEWYTYYRGYSMMSGESRFATATEDIEVIKRYVQNEPGSEELEALFNEAEEILTRRFEEEKYECEVRRLADVIREEKVERIDLLKVDVQRAEMDVLRGLEDADWKKIEQIVMEVHDKEGSKSEGRLKEIRGLLNARGFEVIIEQDELLSGTDRYNLYARRNGKRAEIEEPGWIEGSVDEPWRAIREEELREYVKEKLPDYMAPAAIVVMEELPLTRNGKLDRGALPRPEELKKQSDVGESQYRNAYEEIISGIWRDLLKVDRVRPEDNFFEVGGDSLLATQVISRIRAVFGVEIRFQVIFREGTVEGLASRIEEAVIAQVKTKAPPLVKSSRAESLPLSFAQQRLWFSEQLEPGNTMYLCPGAVRLEGKLDIGALERAINEIVRRHEALRTRFEVKSGEPAQVIDDWEPQKLKVEDLTSLSREEREAEVRRMAGEETGTGFDLSRGPLLRVKVLKLAEEEHLMFFTMHHIVSDAWSMRVLEREIYAFYVAICEGRESPLPELDIQYADYAKWQRDYLTGEVLEDEVGYWKGQLKDAAVMDLPTDHARRATSSHRGSVERVEIGSELSAGLRRLSQRDGATLFMALMAAFKTLLMRYSGEEDISVGTVVANRTRKEVEGLIGFFVNTLVMRTNLGGNPSFRELMRREREVALGAYARQEAPFEKLVEDISPERDLSRSPLFQVMMSLQNTKREQLEIRGLKLSGVAMEMGSVKFDLTLALSEEREEVAGCLEYSEDLYERETIRRMARHYERVIAEVVRDTEQKIGEIGFLSEAEKRQIIEEWNDTKRDETPRFVHEVIAEHAELRGDVIAVKSEQGELSYRELMRRSNQLGNYLKRRGIGPEEVVGICAERSAEAMIAVLGVLKAGAAYTPMDGNYPEERMRYMLEDAGVRVLILHGRAGRQLANETLSAEVIDLERSWEEIAKESEESPSVRLEGDNLAYVIYTSGSTGKPKGVLIGHHSLANSTLARLQYYSEPISSFLMVSPFGFDSAVGVIYWTLCQGGTLVLPEERLERDPARITRLIAENGASHLLCLPTVYSLLLTEAEPGQIDSLKCVVVAGEACSSEVIERHSGLLVNTQLFNEYGPAEGAVWTSVSGDCSKQFRIPAPIGKPIMNVRMHMLDQELGLAPIGVSGEIYIAGTGLARGYLGKPALTAERFIPNRFGGKEGERLYRTGDLGRYLSDGTGEFIGRADEQIKVRGYRIEPGEVEVVLNEHRGVKQGVVVAKNDGGGGKQLVAYVVREAGVTITELKRYVRERLPDYMVPSAILMLEELPVTANGKIDRKKLSVMEDVRQEAEPGYVATRTPVEEMLGAIFQEVLKLDRVGRNDNFFEIGGHSLLATRVISRVRNTFGIGIEVRSIFEEATVAGLARKIEEAVRAGEKEEAPPLVRAPRHGQSVWRPPLSFAQQRLWFVEQLEPGSTIYNCPGAVRLIGRLNLTALERAINEITRRHEVLRTRFEDEAGAPAQVIDEWKYRRLEVVDLTSVPREEREAEVRRMTEEEAGTWFDLRQGPLMRMKVLKLGEEEHVALFTTHHIVSDEWSMGILVREVGTLYQAYSRGEESPLEELPIQYADFAVWQRAWLQGEALERELKYWRKQLEGLEPLELPIDHPRPMGRSYRGASRSFVIESEIAEQLRELSHREGATLFMTLLGGFDVLMSRYSGQEDIALGTDIANRNLAEIEGLIGFFVNQLALRVKVRGVESFGELLMSVREVCLGAYVHQNAPFEKLVEELQPERDLSLAPIFQTKLILQNESREELELEGIRLLSNGGAEALDVGEAQTVKFDLTVFITDVGHELIGTVTYSRDLFEAETIERLMGHYKNVLREIAPGVLQEKSRRPICSLNLLSEAERRQVVVEWNETGRPYPTDRSIHQLFEEQARRRPEAVAAICEEEQISYRELNERANRLARRLCELGAGPEILVGVCLERSIEMVVGLLGILKAGGVYAPMDPTYPDGRLQLMIDDAQISLLLTQGRLAGRFDGLSANPICLDRDWETISTRSPEDLQTLVEPDNAAYVIYTSGSTGKPKGVIVTHRSVSNLFNAVDEDLRFSHDDVWMMSHSYSFDFSVWEMWGALTRGGRLVVAPYLVVRTPEEFWDLVHKQDVTILSQTPSAFRHFIKADEEMGAGRDLNLRAVVFGGEALEFQSLRGWMERRGDEAPQLINMYGITETTVHTTYKRVTGEDLRKASGSVIGKPLANIRMYALDGWMQPSPVGVRGALYISGGGVARGYLGRPDLTAERFIPDLFSPEGGERLYRTGDVARYLTDGNVEFIGRADAQVKIRGYRIELGEIESVLNEHRSVTQSLVIASEDQRGGKRLLGYVVAGEGVTATELKRHVRERLPEYMVPEAILALERMPMTANGKIDLKRLPLVPVVKDGNGPVEQESVRAKTSVEEMLVGIYEEMLKADRVGRGDNFFEIGGHSLLATQVISRIRDVFGVGIGVRSIFEAATVEALAQRVEEAMRAGVRDEAPPLIRAGREGRSVWRSPLSFAQQRLWFLDQLTPNTPLYNIPSVVRLEGRLDLAALERSVNEIVRRHEALRTRFEVEAGEPAQTIDPWEPRRLEVTDLTGLAPEEREAEIRRMTREEAGAGFDLSRGPLLRMKVLKLGEEEHVALFTMHHIVSDGWSMRILSRELGALYRAYLAGEESPLEELPIQYADFAVWQREWLKGKTLEAELEYWRKQLAGLEDLDLPTDHPRPVAWSHRGASQRFVVERELTERLRELSRREGVTLFMTLLGGFDVVMSRYSGQEDIALGTDIANRDRAEIEGVIGFFVNQLVLRVRVSERESFSQLLKRVREVCLGAYSHQSLPFEKLVEELQPERDLSRSPLFQAKLILQNMSREAVELEEMGLRIGSGQAQASSEAQTAKFDLMAAVTDAGGDLVGVMVYSLDLFEAETVERLASHYTNVLRGMVEGGGRPISELSMLSAAEKRQIVEEWNETGRPVDQDRRIHELFAEQAKRTPDRIALIGARERMSYRELNRRANQLGGYLQKLGVGPEVMVGLCLNRSVEMVVALLGVLKAGGAYLPLDPESPLERLSYMLEDAGVGLALTERELEKRLPTFFGQVVCLDEEWEGISEESDQENVAERVVEAENLAYVIYTSGSTGKPKGVMVAHKGLCNLAEAQKDAFGLSEQSRVLQFASFSFDASVSEIFSTFAAGGSLHVCARESLMPGEDLTGILREGQITAVTLPPSVLTAQGEKGLAHLQTVIAAGEACSAEIVERWASGRKFLNAYGPTETTVCASIGECRADSNRKPTIGRPIANTRLYILNREMAPAPVGGRGELYVSGVGVARGYLGGPHLTAERFVPNPFGCGKGERLYRTGDVCRYLSNGEIEFIGRADDQIKVRGYRIEPGEIESVLSEQPGVRQAAVIVREDEPGRKRLVAYVVADLAAGGRRGPRLGDQDGVELWPSVAEYFVYDDVLYYAMTHDERRNLSYRVAINEKVRDKVVLDIGTGADAILARMCVDAGAKKVYAIELLEETYRKAKALLFRLGLEDRIELIHGDSAKVRLPEDVDVCISEIVGSIGGCEGAGRILNDAWRFLKPSGSMIPCRSTTLMAAARLPEALRSDPRFSIASGYYTEKIFEQLGYRFDLRLCVKNFPGDHIISGQAVFEDLDFDRVVPDEESHEITLTITEHTTLDGFLIWLTLYTTPSEVIDILKSTGSWLPVFFPVFYPGLEVGPGDTIKATCSRRLCAENGINPDYQIEGRVIRRYGEEVRFSYQSPHFPKSFKSTPFYQELFSAESAVQTEDHRAAKGFSAELRGAIESRLPNYMAPSAIVLLDRLPLTSSGKLDRKALPAPESDRAEIENGDLSARTPVEEIVAGIFEETLKVERVGRDESFFELGGHSLLATQVVSRVRDVFGVEIGVRSVFEEATAEGLARKVEEAIGRGEKVAAPPLAPVSREERLPLSFAQQRLWFLDQLAPNNPFYNCPSAVRLEGRLDLDALEEVINEIVRRHEALRTRIEAEEREPAQVIDAWQWRSLERIDLTGWPREEREGEALRMAIEEARTGFDLRRGPLLRMKVLKLDEEEHVALLTTHHIVSDAWSMGVLVREVCTLYEALSEGRESPLPELEIQYADYAKWQRNWLQGEVLERQLRHWRERLAGVTPLELPTDYPRPALVSYRGANFSFALQEELAHGIRTLSRREGATLFMTMLAAFQTLLMRYSGQEDIVVGAPIANRPRAETEALIGFFMNTLALRTRVEEKLDFQDLLGRVREVCLSAYAHQDLPFEQLVESLQPERDLSRQPLFQVMLTAQNARPERAVLRGLRLNAFEIPVETSKFDLLLSATEAEDRLVCNLSYNSDLFEATTIGRLIGHFKTLLESIVASPQTRLSEFALLPPDERRQILFEWNQTSVASAQNRCIHNLFEAQAARTPEAVALSFRNKQLSYRELNERANQVACRLRTLGIGPEAVVGICTERSVETLVSVLGILKAGAAYLPLDPAYPLERLSFLLKDSGAEVLAASKRFATMFSQYEGTVVRLDEDWGWRAEESGMDFEMEMDWECPAYVIYTSGSTGRPKGVAMIHQALVNLIQWQLNYPMSSPAWRTLQFTSLSFDVSFQEIFATWLAGGSLVLIDEETHRDPVRLWEAIRNDAVERLFLPFVALQQLAEAADLDNLTDISLRRIITAGEALKLSSPIEKMLGRLTDCVLENQYGPTESHVVTFYTLPQATTQWVKKLPPIGRPVANTQIYILDNLMEPAPVGVIGDLYIGGAALARGYLNRPSQTTERFIPDPFSERPGMRLYMTGDRARYLPDGIIEFIGRSDDQVKVRGYRIELGEIEATLAGAPHVRECAVTTRTDDSGAGYLVGYLVCHEGIEPPVSELRNYLQQRLPAYMVPSSFVCLQTLPLTPSGKLDRRALPSPERKAAPDSSYSAPRTAGEEIMVGIFKEVLKLDKVGRDDNFFEIGGHSLLATQVISRVRSTFGVEIMVRSIFENPTVEGLARNVEDAIRAGEIEAAPPLVRAQRDGQRGAQKIVRLPLSFAQQRLWFIDQLEPGNAVYNCPVAARLEGRLDLVALERSVNEIVRRHETLRTRFEEVAGEPAQVIDPWEYRKLEVEDLTRLPPEEREREVGRMVSEEAETGFDLSRGQLLRMKVLKLGEEEHVALFTMHHVVSDGWSMGILVEEIGALYRAYNCGEESPLEELPIQYADFAIWQRAWLQGEALEKQLDYWKRHLGGELPTLELPTDKPRPAIPTHRGSQCARLLPTALSDSLKAFSLEQRLTLFMTLLAAFKTVLSYLTGQTDILVGTDIANRNRAESEKLIGFFVNQLVLRTELSRDLTFIELLKKVRESALGAYAHQDLPFEKLVEALNPGRDESHSPLFQVKIALQNAQAGELSLPGLTLSPIAPTTGAAKFDLLLNLRDTERGIIASLQYNTDLFEERTPTRILDRFHTLLSRIVEHPESTLRELVESLNEEDSREQLEKEKEIESMRLRKLKNIKRKSSAPRVWRQDHE